MGNHIDESVRATFFFHRMIFVSFCTTIDATVASVAAVVILLVRFHHLIFRIALFLHLDNSPVFLYGSLLFHSVSCSPSWNSVFAHQRYFILLCVNLVMWKGNQLRMNLSFSESMRLFLMYSLSPYFFACIYSFFLSQHFFPCSLSASTWIVFLHQMFALLADLIVSLAFTRAKRCIAHFHRHCSPIALISTVLSLVLLNLNKRTISIAISSLWFQRRYCWDEITTVEIDLNKSDQMHWKRRMNGWW